MKTVFTNTDITESVILKKAFKYTYNGIAIIALDGSWVKVNDSVCELFGYSRKELLNLKFQDLTYKEDLDKGIIKAQRLVSGEIDKYQIENRYFHKSGKVIWVKLSVSMVYKKNGEPLYYLAQFSDITKQKLNESYLEVMLNVAREQNDRLSSFANIITHNLRSHSGNLISLLEFIEEEHESLFHLENFLLLKESVNNLSETVTHLTEVAKIKSINESEIEALNLKDFARKAIYNVSAVAKNVNALIYNNINKDHFVKGIPAYLDSIILNFLTNSIKYRSEERHPLIKLSSEIQNDYVVFIIKDNGLGIDLKKYGDKLFQMYKTFHCKKDSIGIGLFITKNHIESLGGKVIVKSEVNVGTEFSVFLKRA